MRPSVGPIDIYLCLVDHYEPHVGGASTATARVRHEDWLRRYPAIAARHRDSNGRHPAHTFFYPWDEFDAWEFESLQELCVAGWGEIEIHLHHRNDTSESLRRKIREAVSTYRGGGALSEWPDGKPAFGFIHGNWALDNSRHENGTNYCGVNNELDILREEGCYADFTFPAWRHTAQPRKINSIYYAADDPHKPKSYDTGRNAEKGQRADQESLLMVQGPLVPFVRHSGRKWRFAMEDGDLAASHRYSPKRLDRWIAAGIQVLGCPDRIFVKLHCHGAADANRSALLDNDLDLLFSDAEERYGDGKKFRLHYVTAREVYNIIRATEAEDIAARDWCLPRPASQPASVPEVSTMAIVNAVS